MHLVNNSESIVKVYTHYEVEEERYSERFRKIMTIGTQFNSVEGYR